MTPYLPKVTQLVSGRPQSLNHYPKLTHTVGPGQGPPCIALDLRMEPDVLCGPDSQPQYPGACVSGRASPPSPPPPVLIPQPCPAPRLLLPLLCRKWPAYSGPLSSSLPGLLPSWAGPGPCSLSLTHKEERAWPEPMVSPPQVHVPQGWWGWSPVGDSKVRKCLVALGN